MTSYIYDMVDTWNAGATTFTSIKMNVTDTASAAGSLLMDLQVGGSSKFKVAKDGSITANGTGSGASVTATAFGGGAAGFGFRGSVPFIAASGAEVIEFGGGARLGSAGAFQWTSNSTPDAAGDLFLTRRAAANLRLGAADAAAPVAQTLSVQSVVAGTTNTAGANLTITGSQGTGTGAGGSIIFQVAPAGSSGTAQNALATALTINSVRQLLAETSSDAAPAFAFSGATGTGLSVRGSVGRLVQSGTAIAEFTASEFRLGGSQYFSWASNTSADPGAASDVRLYRDAANTLALRNGANAQFLRVYSTYTDASNYERGAINTGADFVELAAETAGTGDDNLDVRLTPAGTGNVRFGTHTATADTAVSGYIEVKDAGGTIRKLAVIT